MTGNTLEQLAVYKRLLDEAIDHYCQDLLQETNEHYGRYSKDALEAYASILRRGGKRLRGALVMNSYEMFGGQDKPMILQAARAIEMMHAYLLIIDDICDKSPMRRGGMTAHISMEKYHHRLHSEGDSAHFGLSMAMTAAITGCHLALLEVDRLAVDDRIKLAALRNLNENLIITGHGQLNDIANEAVRHVDEAQVQRMLVWKTAHYSFLSPLQFGAILAGANLENAAPLCDYSLHMGLAFQLVDDILGTFGDEFESGKSAKDDLREGKITILVSRALADATPEQREQLLRILGDQTLTSADHEAAKSIIQSTGALAYARQLAREHAEAAARVLVTVPAFWQKPQIDFLHDLTTYVLKRNR